MALSPPSSVLAQRARPLWWASAVVFACMPPAMAFANRSAPLFVTLAAVLALLACLQEGSLPALFTEAAGALLTPLGIAALAFLAFAFVSIAWSPARGTSIYAYGELLLPLLAGLALALTLPERAPRWFWLALALLTIGATWVLLIDLYLGLPVRHAMGWRMNTFIYNRPALTLLLIAPPLLTALVSRGNRWLAFAVAGFIAAAILHSESGAAKLGLAIAAASYAIARWSQAVALTAAAAGVIATLALAPIAGDILHRAIPASAHDALATSNSRARVDIWRSFGAAVREQPWLGAGFAPGAAFPTSERLSALHPGYRVFVGVGHPHNGALQIWAELGALGAFLALFVLCLILRALSGLPPAIFAAGIAVLAAAAAVSFVGHGLWQGWWAAAVGAAIVCVRMLARDEQEKIG